MESNPQQRMYGQAMVAPGEANTNAGNWDGQPGQPGTGGGQHAMHMSQGNQNFPDAGRHSGQPVSGNVNDPNDFSGVHQGQQPMTHAQPQGGPGTGGFDGQQSQGGPHGLQHANKARYGLAAAQHGNYHYGNNNDQQAQQGGMGMGGGGGVNQDIGTAGAGTGGYQANQHDTIGGTHSQVPGAGFGGNPGSDVQHGHQAVGAGVGAVAGEHHAQHQQHFDGQGVGATGPGQQYHQQADQYGAPSGATGTGTGTGMFNTGQTHPGTTAGPLAGQQGQFQQSAQGDGGGYGSGTTGATSRLSSGQMGVIGGKLQQATGMLLGDHQMKADGLAKEQQATAALDLKRAQRLEQGASGHRERAVAQGADPSHKTLGMHPGGH